MKKEFSIQKICVLVGMGLLVAAVVMLALWSWNISSSEKQAQYYVSTLQELIPEPQNAVPEARQNNTMPVLSVAGTDFVGIIEMPNYNSVLPVCANWGNSSKHPSLFSGSIYNRTLQIGATSQTNAPMTPTILKIQTPGPCQI